jgi:hypothetical protein
MNGLSYLDIQKQMAKSISFDDAVAEVQRLQAATAHVPAMMRKAVDRPVQMATRVPDEAVMRGPKAAFFDPLSLQYAMGYKDRRYSLTYETLRRISMQLSVVAAIINTRVAQVAAFSQPYRHTKSLGFVIKHKDPEHMTTASERKFIRMLEDFIANCGEPGRPNPYCRMIRDDFESFLKKIVRDTLTYDQLAFEVVPRQNMIPYEFWAVDAATIRLASSDKDIGSAWSYHARNTVAPLQPYRFQGLYAGQSYGSRDEFNGEPVQYVQVVNGQIENVYTRSELAFGIRNPRTDIYIQGYGYGELEQMVTIVTGLLYAEEYNRRYFTQGAHPKGLLNFKGDNWTPDQLEAFRRQWIASVAGVENAWKTPITQSDGIEWINLQMSNKDMEFGQWIEYLIKITAAVYLIDPAEINFDLHGGVQQTPLFESSQEWKLKASRDRGLRPLLRFLAKLINRNIIDRIDDHFVFEFAGLDELTEQEKHELLKEQIGTYLTLNEGRRSLDLPDIEGGDIPLNPVFVQWVQMQQQQAQQQQQMEMQQQQAAMQQQQGQPGAGQPGAEQEGGEQQQQQPYSMSGVPGGSGAAEAAAPVQEAPQYTDNFGKSHAEPKEIRITFDDWKDQRRRN